MFPTARWLLRRWDVQCAIVLCLIGVFSVVAWRSVQSVNTLWDEQQDYPIAVALVQHPLWGTGDHGSQARLPMYAVAGLFALIGESLAVARLVSIVVGALTIVMTWVAGRRWFGGATGLLAAGLLWIAAAAFLEVLAIAAAQTQQVSLSIALWAAGASVMLVVGDWLMRQRAVRWPALMAWLAILLFAMTLCLAAFPEHVIQPAVVGDFLGRLYDWDGSRPAVSLIDNARLYSGILLLKLGVPLGLLSVAALLWACVRALHDGALRWIVIVVAVYGVLLLILPLRQTFYLMSVYPLLVLLLAGFLVQVTSMLHRRPLVLGVWLSVVIGSHLWLIWGAIRVYPEFGWYGYETIGDHWLGEESRGYRNIIQVTNDGAEDALRWLVEHVPAETQVVSYLSDYHVVDAFTHGLFGVGLPS